MATYVICSVLMMNMSPPNPRKKLAMASVGRHHNSNKCGSWIHRKKYVRQQSMLKAVRKRGMCLHLAHKG